MTEAHWNDYTPDMLQRDAEYMGITYQDLLARFARWEEQGEMHVFERNEDGSPRKYVREVPELVTDE